MVTHIAEHHECKSHFRHFIKINYDYFKCELRLLFFIVTDLSKRYNPYEKYGLRLVVNAAGTFTSVGGSMASPEVFKAMEDASKSFMHITWLQRMGGKRDSKSNWR